ncbi:MAG: hypothetical protein KA536_10285 [Saprospiraceae bacterium]|nr:hypothetical protein [Saprospiraceae bacterium]
MSALRIFFLLAPYPFLLQSQDTTKVTIHNAGQFIDKEATICDKVSDVFKPSGENKMIYINFGSKYPDHIFTAVIFTKDQPKFPYNPVEVLKYKQICITGKISEYKGKAQMVLYAPTNINVQ